MDELLEASASSGGVAPAKRPRTPASTNVQQRKDAAKPADSSLKSVASSPSEATGKRTTRSKAADREPEPANDRRRSVSGANGSGVEPANRAKRVRKSKEEKVQILQFVEQGGTHVAAAEKFGVSRTAVTKMVKERELILAGVALSAAARDAPVAVVTAKPPLEEPQPEADETTAPATAEDVVMQEPSPVSVAVKHEKAEAPTPSPPVTLPTAPVVAQAPSTAWPATVKPKPRRVRKTNVEKLEILAFVEQGGSQGAAAEKFGVSRTAVTKMVKEKAAITAQTLSESTNRRKVLQYQHKLSIIEDMLYKWQLQVENDAPTVKITGDVLQSKAMEFRQKILTDFAGELNEEIVQSLRDFKASNGWLHRYMQRRNVRSIPKSSAGAGTVTVCNGALDPSNRDQHQLRSMKPEQRLEIIRERLAQVPLSCIWNLDETDVRHRTTSLNPNAAVNAEPCSKEQLMVTVLVSAAGEKWPLQVIGGSTQLLKDVDSKAEFGINYMATQNARADATTTTLELQTMNQEAKQRQQTWYVLLDHCPSHVAAATILDPTGSYAHGFKFESLILLLLPPHCQPLRHGLLRCLKLRFRCEMLHSLLGAYSKQLKKTPEREGEDPAKSLRSIAEIHREQTSELNAMKWLQTAWSAISTEMARQCWITSSCLPLPLLAELTQGISESKTLLAADDEGVDALTRVVADMATASDALCKYMGIEASNAVTELITLDACETKMIVDELVDDDIVVESLSAQGLLRDSRQILERIRARDQSQSWPEEIVSLSDACTALEKIMRFMESEHFEQLPETERQSCRANLLVLQIILLKARAKDRVSSTEFTL